MPMDLPSPIRIKLFFWAFQVRMPHKSLEILIKVVYYIGVLGLLEFNHGSYAFVAYSLHEE